MKHFQDKEWRVPALIAGFFAVTTTAIVLATGAFKDLYISDNAAQRTIAGQDKALEAMRAKAEGNVNSLGELYTKILAEKDLVKDPEQRKSFDTRFEHFSEAKSRIEKMLATRTNLGVNVPLEMSEALVEEGKELSLIHI